MHVYCSYPALNYFRARKRQSFGVENPKGLFTAIKILNFVKYSFLLIPKGQDQLTRQEAGVQDDDLIVTSSLNKL